MNITSTLASTRQVVLTQKEAFLAIMSQLWDFAKEHPKKTLIILIFEIWIHSLVFQHIGELKQIKELIPFLQ